MANGLFFELIPGVLAGAITLFFAAFVLYHGPGRRTHQALCLVLVFTALSFLTISVSVVQQEGFEAWKWGEMYGDLLLGVPLSLVLFALVTSPGRSERTWWLHPTFWILAIVAFGVLRILDRTLWDLALNGLESNYGGGPISHISWASSLAASVVPLVFIRRALRNPEGPSRNVLLILATGLAAWHLYNSARNTVFVAYYGPDAPTTAGAVLDLGFYVADLACALAAPAWLTFLWIRSPDSIAIRRAAMFLLTTCLFGALDQLIYILHYDLNIGVPGEQSIRFATWATWMLFSSAILAYGILRGEVIGLERKARLTVRASTIAGAFIGVFFVASEVAKQFFEDQNPAIGLVAAGILALAYRPLQRLADRFAYTAIPPTRQGPTSREDAYRSALKIALRDNRLTPREELDLMRLADELGLPADRALELRIELEHAPRRGSRV